jgi:hypothetical protein
MNTNNVTIKPIESITGKSLPSGSSSVYKTKLVSKKLNKSRYEFLGFVDRTNNVLLRPRFYNVRDCYGRFAAIE